MHSFNPDLLRASGRYHADGKPKDPHAHHRAEHLQLRRAERRALWSARLNRILARLHLKRRPPVVTSACPPHTVPCT